MSKYFSYLAQCADGTIYAGYTNDLQKRVEKHSSGLGAKYTRGRAPIKIVYSEEHVSRSEAMKREAEYKRMSRAEKIALSKSA